ncbi:MAG: hypothetical protein JO099_13665 [Acidobacteriia bacterium]|nr:hypothetical protein [Terriglobia bacterium]
MRKGYNGVTSCRANSDIMNERMTLEEAILEKVRRLPPHKREQVLRFANSLDGDPAERRVPSRDRSSEVKWIEENRSTYADHWVALEGDRLIAASMDPLSVFRAAQASGLETPFVVHVLAENPLPFIPGW